MIRNETFTDGTCIYAEVIDLDAGTVTIEDHGVVTLTRDLTAEERQRYGPRPLDAVGASMTLMVVLGLVPLADGANAVGLTPDDLVTEALGWAAAGAV
jgi:hypothetical protein